eukprot:2424406-Rhodomonas_salina.2
MLPPKLETQSHALEARHGFGETIGFIGKQSRGEWAARRVWCPSQSGGQHSTPQADARHHKVPAPVAARNGRQKKKREKN